MSALLRPRLGRQPAEYRNGVSTDRLDRRQRNLDRVVLVLELARPDVGVVADDDWLLLGQQIADARVRVRLRIGAVADDLVDGEFTRLGPPLHRFRWYAVERLTQALWRARVLLDASLALLRSQLLGHTAVGGW